MHTVATNSSFVNGSWPSAGRNSPAASPKCLSPINRRLHGVLSLLWGRIALFLSLASFGCAQPVMTNGFLRLDFDDDAKPEVVLTWGGDQTGTMPEDWFVGCSLEPWGANRLLKASLAQVPFAEKDTIDQTRPEYLKSGNPNLVLLFARALSFDGGALWQYQTLTPAFEMETEVLLGLKLALSSGTHYGWLKLGRAVADLHTPFEIWGYAYHPLPGEAIGAGEPPPTPMLKSAVVAENGSLNFSWDPAWGAVLLEWTDNLATPNWQPVSDGTVSPVTQLPTEVQRFYRLRRP